MTKGNYNNESDQKIEKKAKKEKAKKSKNKVLTFLKIFAVVVLILTLLVGGIFLGGYLYIKGTLGTMQHVDINEDEIEVNEGVDEALEGYRTIALFGVDSRESEIEKGTRSDCIMLAIIDQKTKAVKLVSIYRDTFLKISGKDLDKVNHAYAYGGPQLAISTLNTNLDLNITEFATVNFDSLVDIVDAVGGIKMEITNAEITAGKYNDYIDKTGAIVGKKSSHITKAGTYTLDGVQATAYSRLRYTSGGDYKRTERMRDVLMGIVEKAKKMSIGNLNSLAKKVLPEIYTNISPDEIIGLLPQVATYSVKESIGWPYETKGSQSIPGRGNTWYGIPVTLESNIKRLHKEVFEQDDYQVSNTLKTISNTIINKSGYK